MKSFKKPIYNAFVSIASASLLGAVAIGAPLLSISSDKSIEVEYKNCGIGFSNYGKVESAGSWINERYQMIYYESDDDSITPTPKYVESYDDFEDYLKYCIANNDGSSFYGSKNTTIALLENYNKNKIMMIGGIASVAVLGSIFLIFLLLSIFVKYRMTKNNEE